MKILRCFSAIAFLLSFENLLGQPKIGGWLEPEVQWEQKQRMVFCNEIYVQEISSDSRFGWNALSRMSKARSEAFVGLLYAPEKFVEISGNYGIESGGNGRYVFTLIGGSDLFLVDGRYEDGKSGRWHRLIVSLGGKFVKIGIHSQYEIGYGPFLSFALDPFMIRASALSKRFSKGEPFVGFVAVKFFFW
jgi:hypothetical protein